MSYLHLAAMLFSALGSAFDKEGKALSANTVHAVLMRLGHFGKARLDWIVGVHAAFAVADAAMVALRTRLYVGVLEGTVAVSTVLFFEVLNALTRLLHARWVAHVVDRAVCHLHVAYHAAVLQQPLSFFAQADHATIRHRADYVNGAAALLGQNSAQLLGGITCMAAALYSMLVLSPRGCAFAGTMLAGVAVLQPQLQRVKRVAWLASDRCAQRAQQCAHTDISNITLVKARGIEALRLQAYTGARVAQLCEDARVHAAIEHLVLMANLAHAVLVVGVLCDARAAAVAPALLSCTTTLASSVQDVLHAAGESGNRLRKLQQVTDFIATAATAAARKKTIIPPPTAFDWSKGVVADGVVPAHGTLVCGALHLRALPGTLTVLRGPSGCGKTTALHHLLGIRAPARGTITVGGVALSDAIDVRPYAAVVLQQPGMLHGTVHANIAAAMHTTVTRRDVEAAAKKANAHAFITALPHGYDTVLHGGTQLSGGERQRLAIAHLFLTDAPLIVVDEPSSALDAHNETLLCKALLALKRDGRIILAASHSARFCRLADTVVSLDA